MLDIKKIDITGLSEQDVEEVFESILLENEMQYGYTREKRIHDKFPQLNQYRFASSRESLSRSNVSSCSMAKKGNMAGPLVAGLSIKPGALGIKSEGGTQSLREQAAKLQKAVKALVAAHGQAEEVHATLALKGVGDELLKRKADEMELSLNQAGKFLKGVRGSLAEVSDWLDRGGGSADEVESVVKRAEDISIQGEVHVDGLRAITKRARQAL